MATTSRTRRQTTEAAAPTPAEPVAPARRAKAPTAPRKPARAAAPAPEAPAAPETPAAPAKTSPTARKAAATKKTTAAKKAPPAKKAAAAKKAAPAQEAATAKPTAATKPTAAAKKTAAAKTTAAAKPTVAAKKAAPVEKAASAKKAAPAKEAAATKKPAPAQTAAPTDETAARQSEATPAKKPAPARQAAPAKPAPARKTPAAKKAPAARKKTAATAAEHQAPALDATEAAATEAAATEAAAEAAPAAMPRSRPAPAAPEVAAVPPAAAAKAPAAPAVPSGPAHSAVRLVEVQARRHLVWQPGHACPPALAEAAQARLDDQGHLRPDDDLALPTLLRLAAEARHRLDVDEAVWSQLAADRDARHRLQVLEAAYPQGPASAALQSLLHATALPPFQAEGALFAVIAGRALIADERGLGKRVQAVAAATLWRRHFGVQRVLVLCTPGQRTAWERAFARLAGQTLERAPQVVEGPLHQRQALWSGLAEVRILAPEALDSDAAHIERWNPELLIVDEPQQLPGWAALRAPHALVLCGAPLAQPPTLLHDIVAWLDVHRQGALHALQRVQAAREQDLALDDAELQGLDDGLSRLMLQRLRSEVQEQLPPLVHSERLVPLAPPQREAHERLRSQVGRLLDGWRRCGFLSDTDQWSLSLALRELATACHRSDPADPGSALAEASVAALQAQLDDWAATGTQQVALVCAQPHDRAQLAARLRFDAGLHWLAAGEAPPADTEVVLQVGVPWRLRRAARTPAAPPGQQWVYLAAEDSLELGLLDTWAQREHAPRGPAEPGGQGFLGGQRLSDWLQACHLAWQAAPAPRA